MSDSGLNGLTAAEVAERVARGEVNRVRRSDAAEYLDIVRRNVLTLFNAMVLPAAVALFFLGDLKGGIAVSGFALTTTLLGLVQEVRAKRHLDRLTLLTEARARAVRDGAMVEVASGDVVRGDLLLLAAGDPVLADGTVREARFLEVDEALLTGESDPLPRRPGDRLLSGSFCVAGEGHYRADAVGAAAFAQRTAAAARSYRFTPSPLQKSIDRIIEVLTVTTVVFCLLYVGLYYLRGFPLTELVQMIAATITSMVPQGLVLMATLAFILGAVRLTARGAVVQRLNAVESMASVDTLCMDKTGTLTTNRLRLERIEPLAPGLSGERLCDRLRLFVAASIDKGSKSLAALRDAVGEAPAELLDQLPFKSQNRYSAVHVRGADGEQVLALGAFEALRGLLVETARADAEATWARLLRTGLRLLLFAEAAECPRCPAPRTFAGSLEGFALRPLALLALSDELRPEARDVLQLLARQGIEFKIISGDNADTVRATVGPLADGAEEKALRALADGPVVSGAELEAAGLAAELVGGCHVFGRVSPWQKVAIVQALQAQGRHVAMIGDGVNDVLPIRNAHLGIAMGEGSRASKTVSGLVLETNSFGLLPETLEEGRTIVRNLRRAGKLFLVKNVYTLVLIVGALLLGMKFPYLPQQVTLLNVLTIGLPALLITLSKERSAAAARPGFLREIGWFTLRTGLIIGGAGLVLMRLSPDNPEDPVRTQRTLLLSALVLLGLTTLLRVLTDGESRPLRTDRWFRLLAVAVLPVYLAILYWPPSATFFQLTALGWVEWGLVLAVAVPAAAAAWLSDRLPWFGTRGAPL
jgi:cation-transporting ATPase E